MTELQKLKENWELLGEQDPMWAILSDPSKKDGKWDPVAFFQSGVEDIRLLMDEVHNFPFTLQDGIALDFGCGIGRLTQALCKYFKRCYGVDISSSMLSGAARYNHFGNSCRYLLNSAADLRWFPNEAFDFIYSHLVLQHIPPEASQQYIAEFVRILKAGGLLIFQAPSEQRVAEQSTSTPAPERVPCRNDVATAEPATDRHSGLIDMHALPREQVTNVVRNSGGTFVQVQEYNSAGAEWVSYRYWVTKPRM